MFNIFQKRFKDGPKQEVVNPIAPFTRDDEKEAHVAQESPAVSPEELRSELQKTLMPQPKIVQQECLFPQGVELVHFANIYEFTFWYENNSPLFSERQREALNSLIEARNITLGGCNCDVDKRRLIAEDYFKNFWIQNKNTDLLPTLQNIFKAKKVLFGDFLVFPE